jgi:hypothetical protein
MNQLIFNAINFLLVENHLKKNLFSSNVLKKVTVATLCLALFQVWKGYLPSKKGFTKLKQVLSNKRKNFKQSHIINIQSWLRGIHHHCSKEWLQDDLDKYHFRYNRRAFMETIFDLLMERMIFNDRKKLNIKKLEEVI